MTPDEIDELVRAVSNTSRRRILQMCANGFVSVGDVATDIDLSLASVSEHLRVLRKTGLVDLEREGTRWLYRTHDERVGQLLDALRSDLPAPHRPVRPVKGSQR